MKHLKLMLVAALFAASLGARAQEPQKVTLDASGWLIVQTFGNRGDLDARELPRWALRNTIADQRAFGIAPRQSRLRAAIGIPADGLLAGATLKGLVEADFAGGAATADTVIPRLRHYFISANWKNMSNLTLIVGQFWGVAGGNYFSESLAHFAMPRFGGGGFVFRRSPQFRVSADVPAPGPISFNVMAAALTPGDTGSALSGSPGNTSAFPNLEGRVTGVYKQNGKPLAELGVWGHYGRERYEIAAGGPIAFAQDRSVKSKALGADLRFTLPFVTLVGQVWTGSNLDVLASIAGVSAAAGSTTNGTRTDALSDPAHPRMIGLKSKGGFAQAIITPVKGFQLLAGAGMENPDDNTLWDPSSTLASRNNLITKNTQYSAGTIVSLSSKWRMSFEATRYLTQISSDAVGSEKGRDVLPATQFEVGSLITF
jgi:hypothetical protein